MHCSGPEQRYHCKYVNTLTQEGVHFKIYSVFSPSYCKIALYFKRHKGQNKWWDMATVNTCQISLNGILTVVVVVSSKAEITMFIVQDIKKKVTIKNPWISYYVTN